MAPSVMCGFGVAHGTTTSSIVVVVDIDLAEQFAEQWAAAWNSRDLDRILVYYTDDIVFSSPLIGQILGTDVRELHGKDALRDYWSKGLQLNPDLHFSVDDVKASVDSVVINYRNERGRASAEVLTFRGTQICRGFGAHGRS